MICVAPCVDDLGARLRELEPARIASQQEAALRAIDRPGTAFGMDEGVVADHHGPVKFDRAAGAATARAAATACGAVTAGAAGPARTAIATAGSE